MWISNTVSVWKLLEMSHLNLVFSPIFILSKLTCLVTLFDCMSSKTHQIEPFWHFNSLLPNENVNVRTSLRSQWDFSVIFKYHVVTKHFMDRLLQFHHHSGPKTDCHCFFLHFLSIFDMQELIVWGLEHKQLFFRALGIAAKPEWRRRRSSIGTTLTLTFQVSSVCLKTYFFLPCFHIIQYLHEEGNMEGALLCAVNKKEGPLGITFFPQSSLPISEIHKTRPFILHVFQTYQTTGNLPRRAKRAINQVPN